MKLTIIISLIALITSLTSAILIIILNSRMKNKKTIGTDAFEKSKDSKESKDDRSIEQLAKDIFFKARELYGLKVNSYTNLVSTIEKEESINSSDKRNMMYFFKEIISITYKDEEMKRSKKNELFELGQKIEDKLGKKNKGKKAK